MTASCGAIVPVPGPGTVLLVVPDGDDRGGFVLVDVAQLCASPDTAWAALRRAWARLAEQLREEQAKKRPAGRRRHRYPAVNSGLRLRFAGACPGLPGSSRMSRPW